VVQRGFTELRSTSGRGNGTKKKPGYEVQGRARVEGSPTLKRVGSFGNQSAYETTSPGTLGLWGSKVRSGGAGGLKVGKEVRQKLEAVAGFRDQIQGKEKGKKTKTRGGSNWERCQEGELSRPSDCEGRPGGICSVPGGGEKRTPGPL